MSDHTSGDDLQYTLTFTNSGPAGATGATRVCDCTPSIYAELRLCNNLPCASSGTLPMCFTFSSLPTLPLQNNAILLPPGYVYYISWPICYDQLECTTHLYGGLVLNDHFIEESMCNVSCSSPHLQQSTLVGSALIEARTSHNALALFFSAHQAINVCTASLKIMTVGKLPI